MVLLPVTAAAQKSAFLQGFKDLERAMLAEPARAGAAIDAMATALAAWEAAPGAPAGETLLDDETSPLPMLPLAAYARGFAEIGRGDYRAAIRSLREAAAAAGDERPQLAAAGVLAQEGRDADAERLLRTLVAALPESGVARWWLARMHERLDRVADARREYEVVVSMALTGRAPLYEAIGRLSYAEGDLVRAAAAYEERVRLTPRDPAAYKDLAGILGEQGQTGAALAALNAAVAIDPRDAQAHASIGRIRLDAGRPADAIASLTRAITLAPTMYEARYPLALALRQVGRPEEAARELERFERGRRAATEARRRAMAAESRRQAAEARELPR